MAAVDDTIVALSSGRPPAGIAVVRLSGPRAAVTGSRVAGPMPAARSASLRTFSQPGGHGHIDQGLLLFFPAPHSVTGEDVVEFHCHGGRAVVDALLASLSAEAGVRLAEPGEFTRRALANGRIDLTEAEGLADLLAAETEAQRRAALLTAEGGLRRRVEGWRDRLLELSARAEVAIDYSDEADGLVVDDTLRDDLALLREEVRALLSAPRIEPLRDGVRVVVAGPPNAGKSSLVNALTDSARAIVTPIAGTTRDTIEVPVAIEGLPFVLVDTAGLRDSEDIIEALGIERTERELERADIVLWLGHPDAKPAANVIPIHSKADIHPEPSSDGVLSLSAVSGQGISTLLALLVSEAKQILPAEGQLALNSRHWGLLAELADLLDRGMAQDDWVLRSEELRLARGVVDRITGGAGIDEFLDALFSRFCLGK